eukprot:3473731-Karenia_brevis.AAC.1
MGLQAETSEDKEEDIMSVQSLTSEPDPVPDPVMERARHGAAIDRYKKAIAVLDVKEDASMIAAYHQKIESRKREIINLKPLA